MASALPQRPVGVSCCAVQGAGLRLSRWALGDVNIVLCTTAGKAAFRISSRDRDEGLESRGHMPCSSFRWIHQGSPLSPGQDACSSSGCLLPSSLPSAIFMDRFYGPSVGPPTTATNASVSGSLCLCRGLESLRRLRWCWASGLLWRDAHLLARDAAWAASSTFGL